MPRLSISMPNLSNPFGDESKIRKEKLGTFPLSGRKKKALKKSRKKRIKK